MGIVEKHPAGNFCWFELGTTDQKAAKAFYTQLFGWSVVDTPMGPDSTYTRFQIGGKDVAAAYTLMPQQKEMGVLPHWMLYVAVDNLEATTGKAKAAGGRIVVDPAEVADYGRLAMIQDPTGAVISLWEPRTTIGTQLTNVPGTACWADLVTSDVDAACQFYGAVFGWTFVAGENDPEYLHIQNGKEMIGGVPPAALRDPNVSPHWLCYFLVTDCNDLVAGAENLGAKTLFGPELMENVGTIAVLADPQGAAFALYQQ